MTSISPTNSDSTHFDLSFQTLYGDDGREESMTERKSEEVSLDEAPPITDHTELNKCPLWKTYFRYPVMLNCKAQHTFEKHAVTSTDLTKCPICKEKVSKIAVDKKLQKVVARLLRQLRRIDFHGYNKDQERYKEYISKFFKKGMGD